MKTGPVGSAQSIFPLQMPNLSSSQGSVSLIVSMPDTCSLGSAEACRRWSGSAPRQDLPLINGFSVDVPGPQVESFMAALPPGTRVALNAALRFPPPGAAGHDRRASPEVVERLPGIEKVWQQGFTGKGVTIAVIDSGAYPHPDFADRLVGWADLADGKPRPHDPLGHGTHVAGVALGNGARSAGRYKGVAPEANLVGVRITTVEEAIKALQWVIENKDRYNIKVVNMSLGDYATRSYQDDPWAQATRKAIEAGLVVVVAAGNEGPEEQTISTPGVLPEAITVGAYDDKGTARLDDDQVASFSSRGPTPIDKVPKPDVVAPGVRIFGPLAPGARLDVPELPHEGRDYLALTGTSYAAPMVAGLAAVLLQANPTLTPADVREILRRSAEPRFAGDANQQGAGGVNALKALELARSWGAARYSPVPAPA
ncbi:MAG TPA: S8 family peptidase, partial [Candidatus Nitrosotenuis sp.]|nr:S8 family peptidase [Candidatus Nitrosotenuis sp.]